MSRLRTLALAPTLAVLTLAASGCDDALSAPGIGASAPDHRRAGAAARRRDGLRHDRPDRRARERRAGRRPRWDRARHGQRPGLVRLRRVCPADRVRPLARPRPRLRRQHGRRRRRAVPTGDRGLRPVRPGSDRAVRGRQAGPGGHRHRGRPGLLRPGGGRAAARVRARQRRDGPGRRRGDAPLDAHPPGHHRARPQPRCPGPVRPRGLRRRVVRRPGPGRRGGPVRRRPLGAGGQRGRRRRGLDGVPRRRRPGPGVPGHQDPAPTRRTSRRSSRAGSRPCAPA